MFSILTKTKLQNEPHKLEAPYKCFLGMCRGYLNQQCLIYPLKSVVIIHKVYNGKACRTIRFKFIIEQRWASVLPCSSSQETSIVFIFKLQRSWRSGSKQLLKKFLWQNFLFLLRESILGVWEKIWSPLTLMFTVTIISILHYKYERIRSFVKHYDHKKIKRSKFLSSYLLLWKVYSSIHLLFSIYISYTYIYTRIKLQYIITRYQYDNSTMLN